MKTPNLVKIGDEYYAPGCKQVKALIPEHPTYHSPLARALAGTHEKRKPSREPNELEKAWRSELVRRGFDPCQIFEQKITLALDPPFKSYRADIVTVISDLQKDTLWTALVFSEVKGPHRFREKGIAKLAVAAKTYPIFIFILVERIDGQWKEQIIK